MEALSAPSLVVAGLVVAVLWLAGFRWAIKIAAGVAAIVGLLWFALTQIPGW